MAPEALAFVAAGSNLGESRSHLAYAAQRLRATAGISALRSSPCYRSAPIGPGIQPDYLNAVFELRTTLPARTLLELLLRTEAERGRVRRERWEARTLDLDLLLYADQCSDDAQLTLPHPRLTERNFVVYPLFDLAPELLLPDGSAVAHLRAKLGASGLERLPEAVHEFA